MLNAAMISWGSIAEIAGFTCLIYDRVHAGSSTQFKEKSELAAGFKA